MDLDRTGLHGKVGLVGRGVVTFHKVAFSSRKVALDAKKEANCCLCDSY